MNRQVRSQLKKFILHLNKQIDDATTTSTTLPSLDTSTYEQMHSICMLYYWRAILLFALESYVCSALDCLLLFTQFPRIYKFGCPGLSTMHVLSLFRVGLYSPLERFIGDDFVQLSLARGDPFYRFLYEVIRDRVNEGFSSSVFINVGAELFWYDEQDHMMVPRMYVGTGVVEDPVKGRKIVATKRFSKGEYLFLHKDVPLLDICDRSELKCDHCLTPLASTRYLVCHECKQAKYCSQECRDTASNQYHSILCNVKSVEYLYQLAREGTTPSSNAPIGAVRLLATAIRFRCDLLQMPLMKITVPRPHAFMANFTSLRQMVTILADLKQLFNPKYAVWKLMLMQGKIMNNSFGSVHDISVYGAKSMFNHSCVPNVAGTLVKCVKTIERGEEMCINYGKHYGKMDDNEWGYAVFFNYNFVCECPECVRQGTPGRTWKAVLAHSNID